MKLKIERKADSCITVFLPDFTARVVDALLDLIYTGRSKNLGRQSGDLAKDLCRGINDLYKLLQIDPENGGLPDISDLESETVEAVDVVIKCDLLEEMESYQEPDSSTIYEINKDIKEGNDSAIATVNNDDDSPMDLSNNNIRSSLSTEPNSPNISQEVPTTVPSSSAFSLEDLSNSFSDNEIITLDDDEMEDIQVIEYKNENVEEDSKPPIVDIEDTGDVNDSVSKEDRDHLETSPGESNPSPEPSTSGQRLDSPGPTVSNLPGPPVLIPIQASSLTSPIKLPGPPVLSPSQLNNTFPTLSSSPVPAPSFQFVLDPEDMEGSQQHDTQETHGDTDSKEETYDPVEDLLGDEESDFELDQSEGAEVVVETEESSVRLVSDRSFQESIEEEMSTSLTSEESVTDQRDKSVSLVKADSDAASSVMNVDESPDQLKMNAVTKIFKRQHQYKQEQRSGNLNNRKRRRSPSPEDSSPETPAKVKPCDPIYPSPIDVIEIEMSSSEVEEPSSSTVPHVEVSVPPQVHNICPLCHEAMPSPDLLKHPGIYYQLKHFISKHLNKDPMRLYDFKHIPGSKSIQCPRVSCSYRNESKNTIFTHLAFEHDDLSDRIVKRSEELIMNEEAVKIVKILDAYLIEEFDRWKPVTFIFNKPPRQSSPTDKKVQAKSPEPEPKLIIEESTSSEVSKLTSDVQLPSEDQSMETKEAEHDFICKDCDYKYDGDTTMLTDHIIQKHVNKYQECPLLEAGEKFYECTIGKCKHKNRSKDGFMKHQKKTHGIILRSLIAKESSWIEKGILTVEDFCNAVPKNDTVDIQVDLNDKTSLLENHDESPASPPQPSSSGLVCSSPLSCYHPDQAEEEELDIKSDIENDDDDIMVEYEDVKEKRRSPSAPRPTPTVCNNCDMQLSSKVECNTHIFLQHFHQSFSQVWSLLFKRGKKKLVCNLCNREEQIEIWIKHHIYNNHKRELKKMMDSQNVEWKNLLDFIAYDVPGVDVERYLQNQSTDETINDAKKTNEKAVDSPQDSCINKASLVEDQESEELEDGEIPDEDEKEAQPEVREVPINASISGMNAKFFCSYKDCSRSFQAKRSYLSHYCEDHNDPAMLFRLFKHLYPGVEHSLDASIKLRDEYQAFTCEICQVSFFEEKHLTEHMVHHRETKMKQCSHCNNFVDEDHEDNCVHKDEITRILISAPCSHRRSGCTLMFSGANRDTMHNHARQCSFRPKENFQCKTCLKKFYYKEDHQTHESANKCKPVTKPQT